MLYDREGESAGKRMPEFVGRSSDCRQPPIDMTDADGVGTKEVDCGRGRRWKGGGRIENGVAGWIETREDECRRNGGAPIGSDKVISTSSAEAMGSLWPTLTMGASRSEHPEFKLCWYPKIKFVTLYRLNNSKRDKQ